MKNKKIIKLIIFIIILLVLGIVGTLYEKNNAFRAYLDKYVFLKEKHENNLPKILIEYDNILTVEFAKQFLQFYRHFCFKGLFIFDCF